MPQTRRKDPFKVLKKHKSIRVLVGESKLKIVNMDIKVFHFNPIMVTTYVLSDETGEAVIVDPGNCRSYEDEQIREYVASKNLAVKYVINTHPHIDHIIGNPWCVAEYRPQVLMHEDSMPIYDKASVYAIAFGFEAVDMPAPDRFLKDGDMVGFGNQSLSILYTPGHCDGSICLYSDENRFVITGDLIFEMSVGRCDLPTGNEEVLQRSIRDKILTLADEVTVLPGHGDSTTVGRERRMNPYLAYK